MEATDTARETLLQQLDDAERQVRSLSHQVNLAIAEMISVSPEFQSVRQATTIAHATYQRCNEAVNAVINTVPMSGASVKTQPGERDLAYGWLDAIEKLKHDAFAPLPPSP
jgi:hypothetical protein